MPPKKDKDSNRDDVDSKYSIILEKLDTLTTGKMESDKKLNMIISTQSELKAKIITLGKEVKALQENIETVTVTVQELEREIDSKLNNIEFATFRDDVNKKLDDLENRSKRNNLIFWNVPEGEEKDRPRGCVSLIQDIILLHMKLSGCEDIIIERAHRTTTRQSRRNETGSIAPRPIHVRFINWSDKEFILKRAPKLLKNNPYGVHKVNLIITDDVSKLVRNQRNTLRSQYLSEIRDRSEVKVAFIPYIVPARIQYKEGNDWKFFYLPEK